MHDSDAAVAEIDRLEKTYRPPLLRRRRGEIQALRGVTFSARPGEVFGLLGPNGAGKTTIIKSMLGIIRPTAGTARLFGNPAGSNASAARVGYLPESLRIDSHHTARTALAFYGRLSGMAGGDIGRRRDELLDLVGLRGRDNESVRRFSKGMYQRLGLAQALMHDPDLLILDEPTDGLDPVGRNDVRKVLERLRDTGKTIFLNSHILQEVELVCDRVAILARGKLRAIGSIDEVRQQLAVDRGDQISVTIDVVGDASPIVNSFHDNHPMTVTFESDSANRIRVVAPEQAGIDAVVDLIRARDISIRSITPLRMTLEEAFMSLVATAETEEASIDFPPNMASNL